MASISTPLLLRATLRFKVNHARKISTNMSLRASAGRPRALGSSLGSDSSMIAANDRISRFLSFYSSMVAANHRCFTSSSNSSDIGEDEMKDEYGDLTAEGVIFQQKNFQLENRIVLPEARLCYQTYGTLNEETQDNVIVICHALTGNASLHSWWGDLLGDGKAFDTSKYLIVCCNILGSCYGSTSPQCKNIATGKAYGKEFPDISVQDTVRIQLLMLKNHLKINSIKSVIGGSFGGMQAIEFAMQGGIVGGDFVSQDGSPFVKSAIPIACGAQHTAWQIAVSEVQRQAIYADPNWETNPRKATTGLAVARQMGMVSYRTPKGYHKKFGRDLQNSRGESFSSYGSNVQFKAKSYLLYQGEKFLSRFDPITYVKLTEQMDSHDIARGRGKTVEEVLQQVKIPVMVMGIDSDVLYPLSEQHDLSSALPKGQLRVIHSLDGHDGFLLEQEQVGSNIVEFLNSLS